MLMINYLIFCVDQWTSRVKGYCDTRRARIAGPNFPAMATGATSYSHVAREKAMIRWVGMT